MVTTKDGYIQKYDLIKSLKFDPIIEKKTCRFNACIYSNFEYKGKEKEMCFAVGSINTSGKDKNLIRLYDDKDN